MKKEKDPQLSEISKQLETLIRLSALNLVRDMKTQREQIGLLSDSGFQPKEIADTLRISRIHVNSVIYRLRKGKDQSESPETAPAGVSEAQKELDETSGEGSNA